MSTYDVLGPAFGTGDTVLNYADIVPSLMEYPSQQIQMNANRSPHHKLMKPTLYQIL